MIIKEKKERSARSGGKNPTACFPLAKDAAISLVTCTGDRTEAFKLCCHWMLEQTHGAPVKPQWIIVDDGQTPVDQNLLTTLGKKYDVTYIRETPRPGKNTQRRNLVRGLNAVRGNIIAVIEDDDYYCPEYVNKQFSLLLNQHAQAVGEGNALYYHLPSRSYLRMMNLATASLCQTVFTVKVLPLLIEAANSGNMYFDIQFWNYLLARGHKVIMRANTDFCIGIKGMPGRGNITAVDSNHAGYIHDDNLIFIKRKLMTDVIHYMPYFGSPVTLQQKLIESATQPQLRSV